MPLHGRRGTIVVGHVSLVVGVALGREGRVRGARRHALRAVTCRVRPAELRKNLVPRIWLDHGFPWRVPGEGRVSW